MLIRVKAFQHERKEMKALDDSKIVEMYLARDEAAIKETKEKYGKRLWSLSYGIVCDFQTAEECENDTYMEAWNTIPPHEPKSYFYAFLGRIIRHRGRFAKDCLHWSNIVLIINLCYIINVTYQFAFYVQDIFFVMKYDFSDSA